MRVTAIFAVAVIVGALIAHTYPANGAAFTFTTIDVPGAVNTRANGINDAGQIVGFFSNSMGAHGSFTQEAPPPS